jgi:hypothetical protein
MAWLNDVEIIENIDDLASAFFKKYENFNKV